MPIKIEISEARGMLLNALVTSGLSDDDLRLVRRFIVNAGEEELGELCDKEGSRTVIFKELAKLIRNKQLFLRKGEEAMPVKSVIAQEEQFSQ